MISLLNYCFWREVRSCNKPPRFQFELPRQKNTSSSSTYVIYAIFNL